MENYKLILNCQKSNTLDANDEQNFTAIWNR